VGIGAEFCISAWQRLAHGELQVGGTFGHQNALGMAVNLAAFPLLALWLSGSRGWEFTFGPVAAILTAIMTASRATIGLGAAGYALTFCLSALQGWTRRKATFALVSVISLALLLPFALTVLNARFEANPLSPDYDERAAFQNAALAMLADHPFGVGANNYVVTANTQGYNERAGVALTYGSLSANVHNVYLLVAAETGYLGLATFVVLLAGPLLMALQRGWRSATNHLHSFIFRMDFCHLSSAIFCRR
jgi:O-antigen ligase